MRKFQSLVVHKDVTNSIRNPSPWLNHVMQIFALFMFLGIFTTLLIPETKRKTLEELAGEVPGTKNYDPDTAGHRKESYVAADTSSGEREITEKTV